MKTICVTNRKGGVGKTTVATHLAGGLAAKGYNVGIVDTDSQGHVARMYDYEMDDAIWRVMTQDAPLENEVTVIPADAYAIPDVQPGHLVMLPSGENTYRIPTEMNQSEVFKFFEVIERLATLASLDYVIIDSQPTMSLFDGAIYLATDAFLYVTECEDLSIGGLAQAIGQMENLVQSRQRYLKRNTIIGGIVPNKYRTGTIVHQENLMTLGQHFGKFTDGGLVLAPFRLKTVWTQAANLRQLVYVFEADGEASQDAWRLVDSIEQRMSAFDVEVV